MLFASLAYRTGSAIAALALAALPALAQPAGNGPTARSR